MLTDAAIKRLTPRESAYRENDSCGIPGFCVKVYPSGTRTFELRVSRGGASKYYRLGEFGKTPLPAARDKARAILARLDQGLPAIDEPAVAPATATLAMLIEAWLAHQTDRGRRRLDDIRQSLNANLSPTLLSRPAASITSADIRAVLAAIHQRGSRVMANRVRSALHTCFQYGLQHDHDPRTLHQAVLFGLTANPVSAVPADPGAERAGERVIQTPEIIAIWNDETLSWPVRQGVRLLFATCGQRVNEVMQARWDEFDLLHQRWVIPKERTKNKREHDIPVTGLSMQLLNELRDYWPQSTWLFPSRNAEHATRPWSDTALNHAVAHWLDGKASPRWSPRDIRRTVKTEMGKAGISKATRDLLQNHSVASDVSAKHYDRYDYWPEKVKAAEIWERYLQAEILGMRA